jgi:hypothetical protein
VDIEEFYDADPRRRTSAEIELGRDWRDEHGTRYEVSWVEATGELYVMREPVPSSWATPFGGVHTQGMHRTDEQEVSSMTVTVVGTLATREQVEAALAGWEDAMAAPDGIDWMVKRLRSAGILTAPAPPNA